MAHLSSAELLAYLDEDTSLGNIKKISVHLDKCVKCTSKLKDYAATSIVLELINLGLKEQKEKEILEDCPATETIFHYAENKLSPDDKKKTDQHLKECRFCREELEVIRSTEDISETKPSESIEPEIQLPAIPRYFELYFIAQEREIKTSKKRGFRIPGFKEIREMLFPGQPVLVPLGFSELMRRDPEFYAELDDDQLIRACKRGDDMAWNALEMRFRMYAFKIIGAYGLNNDKFDIWNESLYILFRTIQKYKEEGKTRYFIRKIVINRCFTWKKKRAREEKLYISTSERLAVKSRDSDPLDKLIEKEDAVHLINNIRKIPEKFSSVLLGRLDGLTDREIAEYLSIPVATVRTRKHRARIKLLEMKRNEKDFMDRIRRFDWVKQKFSRFFAAE
jgi:RNA polymerase sigma factor (sigma-70 family)